MGRRKLMNYDTTIFFFFYFIFIFLFLFFFSFRTVRFLCNWWIHKPYDDEINKGAEELMLGADWEVQ